MRSIRVLIVEDYPLLAEAVRAVLERDERIEVVGIAGDGKTGLELVASEQPDVVVTDVSLGGMTGLEAAREIRDGRPDVRVVVMSGSDVADVERLSHEAGATRFVHKDRLIDLLCPAVLEAARARG